MFYFQSIDESLPSSEAVSSMPSFEKCDSKGVTVHEGAQRVEFRPGQSSLIHTEDLEGRPQTWDAKFVVDASGRDTFLSNQLGGKRRSQQHSSAAIFGHFDGVGRLPGKDEGNITAGWLNDGWCWLIPFKDGTTSVGVVCHPDYIKSRTVPLDQFLLDTLRQSPPCPAWKEPRQTHAAANFSYRRDTMSGDGYLMSATRSPSSTRFSQRSHLAPIAAQRGKVVDAIRKSPEYATPSGI
jgi:flavin-dependent dehydrogenase